MKATPWQANAHVRAVRLLYAWGKKELGIQGDNPAVDPELHPTSARTQIWDEDSARHFIADLTLPYGRVLHDYRRAGAGSAP